jgi:hypothetical protein
MEWYRVIKTIKGRRYHYDQKTYRENGRVRTLNRYIGPCSAGGVLSGKTVYHATLNKFEAFDATKAGENTGWSNARFGTFFTDNKAAALRFVNENREAGDQRPVQFKVATLNIQNPLDLTLEGIFTNARQAPVVVELLGGDKGMSPRKALASLKENIGLGELGELHDNLYGELENKALIQSYGYDSIISQFGRDENGETIKEYVAFDTRQISITGEK